MMLSPAAMDTPAASVIVMLVPVLLPVAVPMFLTKAMPARASDVARPNRRASASVATARRAALLRESTVIVLEDRGELRAEYRPTRSQARRRSCGPRRAARATRGGEAGRGAQRGSLGAVLE